MICACSKTKSPSAIQPGVVKSYFGFPTPHVDGFFFFESVGNRDTSLKSLGKLYFNWSFIYTILYRHFNDGN